MCGIAGLLGAFSEGTLRGLMGDMQQRLAHRGPDGFGLWADPEAGIGLVHRRLSIIDLSTAASQPMRAGNGRYTIVFNGEIYNFKSLVPLLQQKGYSFNPNSDTAVLAPLYDLYGPKMLDKLEGMFAFAIWDAETETLFAARDPLGIKPFYYAETPEGFVFASEMKALHGVPGLDTTPDPVALAEYMTYLYTPDERTLLKGIRKLRPGHALTLKRGKGGAVTSTLTRWYKPPLVQGIPQYDDSRTPAQLLELLDAVIAEQCVSDVPVGAFLSGGVDSSAIVASMCATGHAPTRAYCIGFGKAPGMAAEGFGEDIDYAKMVAQRYNIMLNEVRVDAAGVLNRLPGLAAMLDEPEADPAPLFVQDICTAARADGIKVLMSGTGGDDVMTGYRRHLTARYRERLGAFSPLAGFGVGLAARVARGPVRRRAQRLGDLLRGSDDDFILNAFTTNSQADAWMLLRPEWRADLAHGWSNDLTRTLPETQGQTLVNRLLYAELFGFLPDHNLNYGDKASMAAGVEVRVPLIDRRVLAFMAGISPEKKLRGTRLKAFFKESLSGRLPYEVLNRSKTGFGAPVRTWLTGEGRDVVNDTLFGTQGGANAWFDPKAVGNLWEGTQSGRIDGAYTILALCMAVWWHKSFVDKA